MGRGDKKGIHVMAMESPANTWTYLYDIGVTSV